MVEAAFTFIADLNSFLSLARRGGTFYCSFEQGQSVKHLIEAAGVPHTEVGVLTANGHPVGFEYAVQQDDRIIVHPAAPGEGPAPVNTRFVLDNHLGRLAAYLRMLGFDTLYQNNFEDEALAEISVAEERILLTRDRRLLMRKTVQYGYCPRSYDSRQQVLEVVRRYDLAAKIVPFRRCLRCNHLLEHIGKEEVLEQLEPLTRLYFTEFHRCPACLQVYWKGSHFDHMQAMIEQLTRDQTP